MTCVEVERRTLRVGLLGCGTVGQGLCELLASKGRSLADKHEVLFQITDVLVRNRVRKRGAIPAQANLITDHNSFSKKDFDIVVECMGGVSPASELIRCFLNRGVPVVTANKALMAEQGQELLALAAKNRTFIRFEASVAAGIPVLGVIERALQSSSVQRVMGILNGTSNYILTQLSEKGAPIDEALSQAKLLGYAEADHYLDLSGMDAAQKLVVLAGHLGRTLSLKNLEVVGLEHLIPQDCSRARVFGYELKPLAFAELKPQGSRGFVGPALVRGDHPLASVRDVTNGVHLDSDPLGPIFLSGPGAGAIPTAASILDDMLALTKPISLRSINSSPVCETAPLPTRWFLTLGLGAQSPSIDDLLDFVGGTGLVFRELRELREGEDLVICGLTGVVAPEIIKRLATRLKAAEAVKIFRAFRVAPHKEEKIR